MSVSHCASNDLLALFDLKPLTFVRWFLLHGTGSAGVPRLTLKGFGTMAFESGRL